jgi:hypothetical protein
MNYREDMEEGTVFLEPRELDKAVIGVAAVGGMDVLAYSYQGLIEAFMKIGPMTYEDATEWVDFNVLRALPYFGSNAPIVVYLSERDDAV